MNKKITDIQLVKIKQEEKSILERLLELYVYDFTEFMDFDLNDQGLFTYPYDNYFSLDDHHAFFIKVNNQFAGFVFLKAELKNDGSQKIYTIEAFFVLRKYRRNGVGQKIVVDLFNMFPGKWLIFESRLNYPAQAFWRKIIADYTHNNFKEYFIDEKPHQEFDSGNIKDGVD